MVECQRKYSGELPMSVKNFQLPMKGSEVAKNFLKHLGYSTKEINFAVSGRRVTGKKGFNCRVFFQN